jgi:hypothetical protein
MLYAGHIFLRRDLLFLDHNVWRKLAVSGGPWLTMMGRAKALLFSYYDYPSHTFKITITPIKQESSPNPTPSHTVQDSASESLGTIDEGPRQNNLEPAQSQQDQRNRHAYPCCSSLWSMVDLDLIQ